MATGIRSEQIQDSQVKKQDLNSDVAGLGLKHSTSSGISANVDDITINIRPNDVPVITSNLDENYSKIIYQEVTPVSGDKLNLFDGNDSSYLHFMLQGIGGLWKGVGYNFGVSKKIKTVSYKRGNIYTSSNLARTVQVTLIGSNDETNWSNIGSIESFSVVAGSGTIISPAQDINYVVPSSTPEYKSFGISVSMGNEPNSYYPNFIFYNLVFSSEMFGVKENSISSNELKDGDVQIEDLSSNVSSRLLESGMELDNEISERIYQDQLLQSQINNIESGFDYRINEIEFGLEQEVIDRIAGDSYLQNQINTLESGYDQEIIDRINGDLYLQDKITALESGFEPYSGITPNTTVNDTDIEIPTSKAVRTFVQQNITTRWVSGTSVLNLTTVDSVEMDTVKASKWQIALIDGLNRYYAVVDAVNDGADGIDFSISSVLTNGSGIPNVDILVDAVSGLNMELIITANDGNSLSYEITRIVTGQGNLPPTGSLSSLTLQFHAGEFDYPDVNPASLGKVNGVNVNYYVQSFDDTTEEFIHQQLKIPELTFTNVKIYTYVEPSSSRTSTSNDIQMKLYHLAVNDTESSDNIMSSISSGDKTIPDGLGLSKIKLFDTTMSALDWSMGDLVTIHLSRIASTNKLECDLNLRCLEIEFS
jgi:hypothetical protein